MQQEERRRFLIRELQREMPAYAGYAIPEDEQEQRDFLRALFNVRLPAPASKAFLQVQDAYLQERAREKGITELASLRPTAGDARLFLWQGDITTLRCDAILNAANCEMTGCYQPLHNCEDNIVGTYAGCELRYETARQMAALRSRYGRDYVQPTAVPMITPAYNLPSRYIVHVVGPIVSAALTQEYRDQLAACYRESLSLAAENGCRSLALCCLSTGVFRFPQDEAAAIAVKTVKAWLDAHAESSMKQVIFNVYKDSDRKIYEKLLGTAHPRDRETS